MPADPVLKRRRNVSSYKPKLLNFAYTNHRQQSVFSDKTLVLDKFLNTVATADASGAILLAGLNRSAVILNPIVRLDLTYEFGIYSRTIP